MKLEIKGDKEILALLERLPKLVVAAGGPLDRAVTKASQAIASRARQLSPDSTKNAKGNSRTKQSWASYAKWQHKLKSTIKYKIVRYDTLTWAVVGPSSPFGNMAHFMQEKPRRHVLWGKKAALSEYRIQRNWIVRAFDETKSTQLAAIKTSLQADIDKNMRS